MTVTSAEQVVELAATIARERQPVDAGLRQALSSLQTWQSRRLSRSFADLREMPRYSLATAFFLDELYGDRDVSWRDRDLNRVLPYFKRWLPRSLLTTLSLTLELDLISHRLDVAMAERLVERPLEEGLAGVSRYAATYRQVGRADERARQLDLLQVIGREIDRWAQSPLLPALLKLARGPAKGAGLDQLHGFLGRGFAAFRHMRGAEFFLATIDERERHASSRMFAAHPRPFEVPSG